MSMFMGKMMITVHLANFKTPFAKPNALYVQHDFGSENWDPGPSLFQAANPNPLVHHYVQNSMIFELKCAFAAQLNGRPANQHELISTGQPWTGHQTLQNWAFRGFSWTLFTNKQKLVTESAQLQRI